MREVKFRLIKDKEIIGYEKHKNGNVSRTITLTINGKQTSGTGWSMLADEIKYTPAYFYKDYDFKDEWTGLKDKNGKETYEGDIVNFTYKYQNTKKEYVGIVKWDDCNPCFMVEGQDGVKVDYDFIMCGHAYQEIIGNIHENPGLAQTFNKGSAIKEKGDNV